MVNIPASVESSYLVVHSELLADGLATLNFPII